MRIITALKTLFLAIIIAFPIMASSLDIPPLVSPVEDYAGLLDANQKGSLELKIVELSNEEKAEVAILTVPSLEDEKSAEAYAMKIFHTWELNPDHGVLIFIAQKEGQATVLLGQKLKSKLSYHTKKRLMSEMHNFFKNKQSFEGLNSYVVNLNKILPSKADNEVSAAQALSSLYYFSAALLLVVIIALFQGIKQRRDSKSSKN